MVGLYKPQKVKGYLLSYYKALIIRRIGFWFAMRNPEMVLVIIGAPIL